MRATKIYENIKHLFWAAVWGFVMESWSAETLAIFIADDIKRVIEHRSNKAVIEELEHTYYSDIDGMHPNVMYKDGDKYISKEKRIKALREQIGGE